ncbi:MAG TPA: SAM-dependent chlorinase/fluorinase [Bryobacteraceae bacterium]|nr:SAM-dependent chlorinase/fluorinase [Bryobacteraceae bacterium]
MRAPIVTLTTDFGLSDHYVGSMKGVILRICPGTPIIDISHEVTPYAIAEGAYLIAQAYLTFPRGSVHVVVVDPGVGSERRPILMEAAGQYFIAPDNGVLGMIIAREKHKVRAISNSRYFHHPVSQTFHGRDIFAPAGGHLASGVRSSSFGKIIADYVRPSFAEPRQTGPKSWAGEILKVDHFGNIVTNFRAADFPRFEEITIGVTNVGRLVRSYAESPSGELVAIAGSSGYWEVSLNQGSAADRIGCRAGDACHIRV